MAQCCICLEDFIEGVSENSSNSMVITKHCSCRVKLHEQCLKKLEENGMDCPICRHKKIIIRNNYINNYISPLERMIDARFERIIDAPWALVRNYPNIFTFMLMILYTMTIGILFYFPILFFYVLSYSRPFRILICFIVVGSYLYYNIN